MTIYDDKFAAFNKDIEHHTVTILRDDGLYRHLRCTTGSYCMEFDVITWPGHLCYSGDMGTYVFSRLLDMFEFFRDRRQAMIDRRYLAEKAVGVDKTDSMVEYNSDLFRAAVKTDYDAFVENWELSEGEASGLWQAIQDEVLSWADDQHDAVEAAMDFTWSVGKQRYVFPDFTDHRLTEYTLRFWWACYAIPWAIEHYDTQKTTKGTL